MSRRASEHVRVRGTLYLVLARFFYGPWDWLVTVTSARQRRAFGGWTFVMSLILAPFLGDQVFFVTALSLLALIPNLTSETPVETEDE